MYFLPKPHFITTLVIFLILPCYLSAMGKKDSTILIPKKHYFTKHTNGNAITIDGLAKDEAWKLVDWTGGFRQFDPEDGAQPAMDTEFKVLYDDKNLYVLVRAHDDDPHKIDKRLSRRDDFPGDWVEINIDSYYDKRTAFSFNLSASGVKGDEFVSNDGSDWDSSWDPIWYGKSSIDEHGWIAEMRIPLSQLRFANKPEHIWGLQVLRRNFREQERSSWQYKPQSAPGWVQHFGELRGLKGIKPQNQLEIMPYVVAKAERYPGEKDNHYVTGSDESLAFGVDGKIGLTSDITLDFTINPDFGQVEADPSQVNLSAFELFFRERRPFFIEGSNIYNFPLTEAIAGGRYNVDNLFYSRRIGKSPSYYPETEDGEFVDLPQNTTILGALKLTGKNKDGLNWGIMESVTQKEYAKIHDGTEERKVVSEPLTNYLVGRVQKESDGGNTLLGGIATATNRMIDEPHLNFLHRNAYSAGIDFMRYWKDRTYYLYVKQSVSQVNGSEEAISNTQEASQRFFQRPDFRNRSLDTTRTDLTGTAGTIKFGKMGGDIIMETGITYRSPEYELNDLGFLRIANEINQFGWMQYRILEPFSIFRRFQINLNEYFRWDFDGVHMLSSFNMNTHLQFKNFMRFSFGSTYEGNQRSNADLRGGPAIRYPDGLNLWWFWGSDNRKRLRVNVNGWNYWGRYNFSNSQGIWMELIYRPFDALNISIEGNYEANTNEMQYITTEMLDNQNYYLLGRIDQKTLGLSMRFTYNINPDLSIQFWGQPFVSKGRYNAIKKVTQSIANEYEDRFHTFTEDEIVFNAEEHNYKIDLNGNGNKDVTIEDPDFNFQQFRSNMVLRWEYIPGSTLFMVWSSNVNGDTPVTPGQRVNDLTQELFQSSAYHTFILKYTYRFRL